MLVSTSVCFGLITILSLFVVFLIVGAGMTISRRYYTRSWILYEIAFEVIVLSIAGAIFSLLFAEMQPGQYSLKAVAAFMFCGYPALAHLWVKEWQRYAPPLEWRRDWVLILKIPGCIVSACLFAYGFLQNLG